jgi:micrococcal nuclease
MLSATINFCRRFWPELALGVAVGFVLCVIAGLAKAEVVSPAEITITDGDTFRLSHGERIRLINIDTPEVGRAHCRAEREAGIRARERLRALLSSGPVDLTRFYIDRFGRTVSSARLVVGDVGQILLAEGHALVWRPGPAEAEKRRQHWCGAK